MALSIRDVVVIALCALGVHVSGQAAALMPGVAAGGPLRAESLTQILSGGGSMQQLSQHQQQDQFQQFQQYQQQQAQMQKAREEQIAQARQRENERLWREAMQEEREEEHQQEQQVLQKQKEVQRQKQLRQEQLQNANATKGGDSGAWLVVQEALSAARVHMMYFLSVPAFFAIFFGLRELHRTAIKEQWRFPVIRIEHKSLDKSATECAREPMKEVLATECVRETLKEGLAKAVVANAEGTPKASAPPVSSQPPLPAKTSEHTPIYMYEGTMQKYGSIEALHEVLSERLKCAQNTDNCLFFAVGNSPAIVGDPRMQAMMQQ